MNLHRLGELHQISLNVFFDGMVKDKEQNSIYLLWGCINELPISERFKSENLILLGIWCHPIPPPNCAIAPFVHQLRHLRQTIVPVEIDGNVKSAQCTVMAFITDFVARAKVTKIMQYNGRYGCPKCLHLGQLLNSTNYYPCIDPHLRPLRTHDWVLHVYENFASLVSEETVSPSKKLFHYKGIKGFSVLSLIPDFDLILDVCLEFQHQLYINICSNLYDLTIAKKCDQKYLNKVLGFMKIPREFKTWNLDLDYVHKWSAIDHRYFLTYYWIPLMHQAPKSLPDSHWNLWTDLIFVNWCLSGKVVSKELIALMETKINRFQQLYQEHFGVAKMTINIHSLLHVRRDIERFGLAWTHSAWAFESENGIFGRGINGNKVYLLERLRSYEERMEFLDSESKRPKELQIQHKKISGTQFYITRPKRHHLKEFSKLQFPGISNNSIKKVAQIAYFYDGSGSRFDAEWHSMARFTCNCGVKVWRGNTEYFAVIQQIYSVKTTSIQYFIELQYFEKPLIKLAHYSAFAEEPKKEEIIRISNDLKISGQIQFKLGVIRYFCSRVEQTSAEPISLLESHAAISLEVEGLSLGVSLTSGPEIVSAPTFEMQDYETVKTSILKTEVENFKKHPAAIWSPMMVTALFIAVTNDCCLIPAYPIFLRSVLDRQPCREAFHKFFTHEKSQILFWPVYHHIHKEWQLLILSREMTRVFMFLYSPCGKSFFEDEVDTLIRKLGTDYNQQLKPMLVLTEPTQQETGEGGILVALYATAICNSGRLPTPGNIHQLYKKGGGIEAHKIEEAKLRALSYIDEVFF